MQFYNQLKRQKQEFIPITAGEVKIYACGPTVYNYFHIGNARAFITFDVLRRYLEYRGHKVVYVQNITDIDDKIIIRAQEEGMPFNEFTAKYIHAFQEDCAALGIKPPSHQPRASEVISDIIDAIQLQIKKGYAYELNGDVYFDTSALPEYGMLSGKKTEDLLPGARVEENTLKKHPADFALWKRSKPGEPFWDSPWGQGRPGWHTECVVMSRKYLGETFDIHAGGIDLLFPHHENELAQALAMSGKLLANYWLYNGFLNIEGEKMSKSLDNFFTARDILHQYSAEAIRFFFLSKHYRSPIDFSREIIDESERAVNNFYSALKSVNYLKIVAQPNDSYATQEEAFIQAMDDDMNTAKAIAVLFELTHQCKNVNLPYSEREQAALMLVKLGEVLGFFQNLSDRLKETLPELSQELIQLLINYREQARREKNWALADQIREDLISLGIELRDTTEGCIWTFKS
jgi:cysteinyl-tRNA synthetase